MTSNSQTIFLQIVDNIQNFNEARTTVYSKSRRVGTDGIYESSRINCVW